jgi:integrase
MRTEDAWAALKAAKGTGKPGGVRIKEGMPCLALLCRGGAGYWTYTYRNHVTGDLTATCLGTLDTMSPLQARQAAKNFRPEAVVRDPITGKRLRGTAPVTSPAVIRQEPASPPPSVEDRGKGTFGYWAEKYLTNRPGKKAWTTDTIGRRTRWLRELCAPLTALPIESITREQIAEIIQPKDADGEPQWDGVRERARLVIETVFSHADVKNPASLTRLKTLLRARPEEKAEVPQPSMPWQDVPDFMVELGSIKDVAAARALKFLILTGVRKGDVLGAKWEQFNPTDQYIRDGKPVPASKHLETDIPPWSWNIPRTKNGRPHRVPLSLAARALLGTPEGPKVRVFAVAKGRLAKPCKGHRSDQPGRDAVPHGFRTTVKQWAIKHGVPREISEAVIEHVEKKKDKAERAYDRDDRYSERIPVMDRWAAYVTSR